MPLKFEINQRPTRKRRSISSSQMNGTKNSWNTPLSQVRTSIGLILA
jgi:hypothetical protein